MSHTAVTFERQDAVAIVTLARPDAGNAINKDLALGLLSAAIACEQDPAIRCVLLQSSGKLFCGGGDLGDFDAAGDRVGEVLSEVAILLHAAISTFVRMEKPLVTAVQGFAAGAGFSLAIMGDIVIASEAAKFTLAYSGVGLSPDGGASWFLPRLVGLRKAQELLLLNPRIEAHEALSIGLVTKVVAANELEAEARSVAARLAEGATRAFGRSRSLLWGSSEVSLDAQLSREAQAISKSVLEPDGREGVAAFREGRKPDFFGMHDALVHFSREPEAKQ